MKKLTALLIAVMVIGVWAGANACGNDNGSTKKVDASKVDDKVMVVVSEANASTIEAKASECPSVVETRINAASAKTVEGSSTCASGENKAMTADVVISTKDCAVSKACPTECKGEAKVMKAKTADSGTSSNSVVIVPITEDSDR